MGNQWQEQSKQRTVLFPSKLKELAPDIFDYDSSEWCPVGGKGHKDEGVCRVAAGLLGIDEAFTVEASYSSLHASDMHLCVGSLLELGRCSVKAAIQCL